MRLRWRVVCEKVEKGLQLSARVRYKTLKLQTLFDQRNFVKSVQPVFGRMNSLGTTLDHLSTSAFEQHPKTCQRQ